jgi:hypothetical protein
LPPTRDISRPDIVIAVLQRAAIHDLRVPGDTMTSPYLNQVRSTRKIIEELILAREFEPAKTTTAAQRRRVERDLIFLRDELARIDGHGSSGYRMCASCSRPRIAPR